MPDPVMDALRTKVDALDRIIRRMQTQEYVAKAGDAATFDGHAWSEIPDGAVNAETGTKTDGDITTNSVSFTSTGVSVSITIATGSSVLIWFTGVHSQNSATGQAYFDIHDSVSGTLQSGTSYGICTVVGTTQQSVNGHMLITGLAAGAHTLTLYWRVVNGGTTSTLHADAGDWAARLTAMEIKA